MPKQIPGYKEYKDKLTAAQKAAEEKRAAAAKKKADDAEKEKQEKLKKSAEKLETKIRRKKVRAITKQRIIKRVFKALLVSNMITFVCGSILWLTEDFWEDEYYDRDEFGYAYSGSYWKDLKDAYGADLEITLCNVIVVLTLFIIALIVKREDDEDTLKQLEKLKDHGVDMPQLIEDLTPSIKKILKSLSKIDRGYFDNLAAGGLDKADYETCVAIISGYLKAHPKEYNKIIAIIDEATLPPEIVKKYGKGKTVSFAAAQAMKFDR